MDECTQVVELNTQNYDKGGERMGKTDFGGFFIHTLDQKNRVFIPAEFRSKLGAEFVDVYCENKRQDHLAFQQDINAREYRWFL